MTGQYNELILQKTFNMRLALTLILFFSLSNLALGQTATMQDSISVIQPNYLKRSGHTMIGGSVALIAGSIGLINAINVSNVKIRKVMAYGSYGLFGVAGVLFIMAGNDLVKASRQFDNKNISFQLSNDGIGLVLRY